MDQKLKIIRALEEELKTATPEESKRITSLLVKRKAEWLLR